MAQHVTFARMQVQPGKLDELMQFMNERPDKIAAKGWERSVAGKSKDDPNTLWIAVSWDTSERYYANAEDSEQNKDYERMRALLTSDPEWFDCDVVQEQSA